MKVLIQPDYPAISHHAADEIMALLAEKPDAVLCIASGDSPKLACELFVKKVQDTGLDTSRFFFIGLDEWVGLDASTKGSCHYDFVTRLFDPLGIAANQYHLFNGRAADLQKECEEMDRVIREKGGIDLMIVGIGMNGHIGFNEPGVDFNLLSHVIDLDETTLTVGQKYFNQPVTLTKGITLGLAHLMAAKKVLLMANGTKKAAVIQKAVEEPVSNAFPASILQQHPQGVFLVDEAAASSLKNRV